MVEKMMFDQRQKEVWSGWVWSHPILYALYMCV